MVSLWIGSGEGLAIKEFGGGISRPLSSGGSFRSSLDKGVIIAGAALKSSGYFFPFQFPWKWGERKKSPVMSGKQP